MTISESGWYFWIKSMKDLSEAGNPRARKIINEYMAMTDSQFRQKYSKMQGVRT